MDTTNQSYPLLDLSQLEMLMESVGEESIELINELLDLYEQESSVKINDLKQAKANQDGDAFGYAAHALAGSSANIGGSVLWEKAKSMENNCKGGEPQLAFSEMDDLEETYRETLNQLRAYLANQG